MAAHTAPLHSMQICICPLEDKSIGPDLGVALAAFPGLEVGSGCAQQGPLR